MRYFYFTGHGQTVWNMVRNGKIAKHQKRQKKIMDLFADAMNAAWP